MKFANLTVEHPFFLAPMAGITTSPFRRLMKRHGAALVVSELISANGIHYSSKKTAPLLGFTDEERPIGLQLFGEDRDKLVQAVKHVESLKPDFLDLNLACPVHKVVRRGAGAAMCRDLLKLADVLKAVVRVVSLPVSIKIRTGWDSDSRNAKEVVKIAADCGVSWVAVHGRTRAQGYSGEADWDYIGEVKAASPIPVIGNGDLFTPEIAIEKLRTYGVDAVMVGRAVLHNPFFFEQVRALFFADAALHGSGKQHLKIIDEFWILLLEEESSERALLSMRKFLAWFSWGMAGSHEFRKEIFEIASPDVLQMRSHEFFGSDLNNTIQEQLVKPAIMGGHG